MAPQSERTPVCIEGGRDMSGSEFNISGNYISGTAIGEVATVTVPARTAPLTEFECMQILSALQGLKLSLDKSSIEYRELLKIEEKAKKRDSEGIWSAAGEFAKQFSSAALANMFSGGVLHLLGL